MTPEELDWTAYPCDEWGGARDRDGYGRLQRYGLSWLAHRLEWTTKRGPIPQGMAVLHRCDNPPCREINHLFLGTHADNMADRRAKGRQARGEAVGTSKLTEALVREMRARHAAGGVSYRSLAREHGLAHATVRRAIVGAAWKAVAA